MYPVNDICSLLPPAWFPRTLPHMGGNIPAPDALPSQKYRKLESMITFLNIFK